MKFDQQVFNLLKARSRTDALASMAFHQLRSRPGDSQEITLRLLDWLFDSRQSLLNELIRTKTFMPSDPVIVPAEVPHDRQARF